MTTTADPRLGHALATDYFFLREQLTDRQLDVLRRVREFVDNEVLPMIGGYWERAELPWPLIRRLGDLGIVGEDIEGYGCPGLDPISCGLVHMELGRGDGRRGCHRAGGGPEHAPGAGPRDVAPAGARDGLNKLHAAAWPRHPG